MTATDELRRLLDERGVKYTANDGKYVKETCWPYMGELMAAFAEYDNGETRFACDTWCFTPEQAIAATLERGACHDKNGFDPSLGFECTVCGTMVDEYMVTPMDYGHQEQFRYCPGCGARVVRL